MSTGSNTNRSARKLPAALRLIPLLLAIHSLALAEGTMDGGSGGHFRKDRPVRDEDVIHAINRARLLAPFVLNYLEASAQHTRGAYRPGGGRDEQPVDPAVLEKLFSAEPNAFQRLQSLKFVPAKKACRNKYGQPRAASALPVESDEICFSLPLIRRGAKQGDLSRRVLALAIHELLHKQGISDEARPEALEKMLRQALPADPENKVRTEMENLFRRVSEKNGGSILSLTSNITGSLADGIDFPPECREWADENKEKLAGFLSSVETALQRERGAPNAARACFAIANLLQSTSGIHADLEQGNYPLEILRPERLRPLELREEERAQLSQYCQAPSAEAAASLKRIFTRLNAAARAALEELKAQDAGLKGTAQTTLELEAQ